MPTMTAIMIFAFIPRLYHQEQAKENANGLHDRCWRSEYYQCGGMGRRDQVGAPVRKNRRRNEPDHAGPIRAWPGHNAGLLLGDFSTMVPPF